MTKKLYISIVWAFVISVSVTGCGNVPIDTTSPRASSFAAAQSIETNPDTEESHPTESMTSGSTTTISTNTVHTAASVQPEIAETAPPAKQDLQEKPDSKPDIVKKDASKPAPAANMDKKVDPTPKSNATSATKLTTEKNTSPEPVIENNNPLADPSTSGTVLPPHTEASKPTKSKTQSTSPSSPVSIGWSEFFDDDKQDTPSDRFWDLNDETVTITGYMGEVLSFEKNWFLIIPKPGAECPFDNGDETYWNKIMIAFVPDDVKLRYHSGPFKITGQLNVGIKIDESGYKTMFRLYNANFEAIKE